jgi:hypothetical protein
MPFLRERVFVAAGGVAILAAMALLDYLQHPKNPTRIKEYGFLLCTTFAGVAYGVAHDPGRSRSRRRRRGATTPPRPSLTRSNHSTSRSYVRGLLRMLQTEYDASPINDIDWTPSTSKPARS